MAGRLILVATPIGNLGDLSPRAVTALAAADVVACEDTRHSRKLLTHAGVSPQQLLSVHAHNEAAQSETLVRRMQAGETVALITDAGTPGISDPGERVVAAAVDAGVVVEVVPGPSAPIAALVVSGLPTARFVFEGFLPRKGKERSARLAAIGGEERTVVLFESPHRVEATLSDLARVAGGDRRIVLARELTKLHEEVWRGSLADAVTHAKSTVQRGEYVVVLAPAPAREAGPDDIDAALRDRFAAGEDRKSAVASVAASLGVPKREVYDAALRLSRAQD